MSTCRVDHFYSNNAVVHQDEIRQFNRLEQHYWIGLKTRYLSLKSNLLGSNSYALLRCCSYIFDLIVVQLFKCFKNHILLLLVYKEYHSRSNKILAYLKLKKQLALLHPKTLTIQTSNSIFDCRRENAWDSYHRVPSILFYNWPRPFHSIIPSKTHSLNN